MTGGSSRLRRARRVVVGGLVGGALVLIDRKRRRRDPAPARGGDPLAAFTSAPCYREGAPPPGPRPPSE
jgi:hypothetical protein